MKIILAGYNLDSETVEELRRAASSTVDPTPETVAAAYARISRSPRPVDALRDIARKDVQKARASNRSIVFEMGHSSIAEHAVFNIDVLGVSRLLVEEIERFRLVSYTEKSQRYVLLADDVVIPDEIRKAGLADVFGETVRLQNRLYHALYGQLRPHVVEKHPELAADPANRPMLEGWAKEDARYAISLATETQLGMTINARNLELMLRRLAAHPLAEAREYSRRLYQVTKTVAPSLIRYTEATEYDRTTRRSLAEWLASYPPPGQGVGPDSPGGRDAPWDDVEPVRLIHCTPHADERVLAALIHSASSLSMARCLEMVDNMGEQDRERLLRGAFREMKPHDPVLREFEYGDLQFEMTVSASCFAQLKRHRMATLTGPCYDPALGVTIPPAISEIGMDGAFREVMDRTEGLYERLRETVPPAAPYILTNAHRRRVSMKVNARELYHIARLRADRHAQWDIRRIAEEMLRLGRQAMPLSLRLAVGKDGFAALHERFMEGDGPG